MNNIFYNNNQGQQMFMNHNPIQNNAYPGMSNPQTNFYQNPGFLRQVGTYMMNNYSQPINTQVMANNNNNYGNTNGPQPLISGRIGRLLIASEDLDNFKKSLQSSQWTNNPSYLQASGIKVEPLFNKSNGNGVSRLSKPCFDNYFLDVSISNNFQDFKKEIEERNLKIKEDTKREKEEFIKFYLPNDKSSININEIFYNIGNNKAKALERDQNLYKQIEKYLPFISKTSSFPKPILNANDDSEKKIYTNTKTGNETANGPFEPNAAPPPGMGF